MASIWLILVYILAGLSLLAWLAFAALMLTASGQAAFGSIKDVLFAGTVAIYPVFVISSVWMLARAYSHQNENQIQLWSILSLIALAPALLLILWILFLIVWNALSDLLDKR